MSAATQPRWQDGREVVRCKCGLIQFKAASGLCVKSSCRKPYVAFVIDPPIEPEPEDEIPVAPILAIPVVKVMPHLLTVLRRGLGLSQRQMAKILGCPRTYISKIENAHATPTLSSFERICYTLDITMENFLYLCEHIHEQAA